MSHGSWQGLTCIALLGVWTGLLGATQLDADQPPGRGQLKGRIGETELSLAGQCRVAQKGRPFAFWTDGVDAPAGSDTTRDGLYLAFTVTQVPGAPRPLAAVHFADASGVVLSRSAIDRFTLTGNTLGIDTEVPLDGASVPSLLRLAIVCDTR